MDDSMQQLPHKWLGVGVYGVPKMYSIPDTKTKQIASVRETLKSQFSA